MYQPERESSLQDLANVGKPLTLSLPRTSSVTDLTGDHFQIKPASLNRSSSFSNILSINSSRSSTSTDIRMYKPKWKSVCDLHSQPDNISLLRANSMHSLWSSERHLAPEDVGSVFTYARYRYKRGIFREYIYSFLSKKAEIVTRRRVSKAEIFLKEILSNFLCKVKKSSIRFFESYGYK